jgi:hypothetical protein
MNPDWEQLSERAAGNAASGLGPLVPARYPGRCAACGDRWEPGDLIRHDDDEDGWVCEACGAGE